MRKDGPCSRAARSSSIHRREVPVRRRVFGGQARVQRACRAAARPAPPPKLSAARALPWLKLRAPAASPLDAVRKRASKRARERARRCAALLAAVAPLTAVARRPSPSGAPAVAAATCGRAGRHTPSRAAWLSSLFRVADGLQSGSYGPLSSLQPLRATQPRRACCFAAAGCRGAAARRRAAARCPLIVCGRASGLLRTHTAAYADRLTAPPPPHSPSAAAPYNRRPVRGVPRHPVLPRGCDRERELASRAPHLTPPCPRQRPGSRAATQIPPAPRNGGARYGGRPEF